MIYAPTKFEVATSNGLGEDTITRNVTDGRTDRQTHGRTTDRLCYEINIPYFSYEKAGIIKLYWVTLRFSFVEFQHQGFEPSTSGSEEQI